MPSRGCARCRNGPEPKRVGRAAVPQGDDVNGVRTGRPQASSRDSHGALCRDRRVAGTEQRVRGGWDRTDRPGGQGGERARGADSVPRPARPGGDADRARGRTAVAVAACRPDAGRARGRAARDPPGEGGAVGDGGEDRPQGCARHRSAVADGLVSAGALQVAAGPGGPGAAGRAQALAGQALGCRAEHPGHLARLRAEGRRW